MEENAYNDDTTDQSMFDDVIQNAAQKSNPTEDDFKNAPRLTGNTIIVVNFEKDGKETDARSVALMKTGKSAGNDTMRLTGKSLKDKIIRREIPMRTILKRQLVIRMITI